MPDGSPITSRWRRTGKFGTLVAGQSARVAGGRALDKVRTDDAKARAQSKRTADVVEQIVVQLGSMKGAAMKVGQVLSTAELPGMDEEASIRIQRRLAELRDSAPKVPFDKLEKLMASEWGQPVRKVLSDIDPDAIAAASIGQVHRATTVDGADVAIKVQYPGIAEAVEADLRNLRMLMPLLARLAPGIDADALADELRDRILEELDYELEASNQRRVERLWRGHPHVVVPKVDLELSTRRVLVTERLEGYKFDDVKLRDDATRDRLAEVVHRFYYTTAGDFGIALGDPHPGNWQLLEDGRAVIFDFGMLRELPPGYLRHEGPAIQAIRDQDPAALWDAMQHLGYLGRELDRERDVDVVYAHMLATSRWLVGHDQPVRLDPDVQREIGQELLSLGADWRRVVRAFALPAEAVLLRRMADLLFVGFCQMRAAADWWALAEELQLGRGPSTALGVEHAEWAQRRGHKRPVAA